MQRAHILLPRENLAATVWTVLTSGRPWPVADFRIARITRESKLREDVHGKVASLPEPRSDDCEKSDPIKALADPVELVVMRVIRSVLTKECATRASEFLAFGRAPFEA